MVRNSSHLSLLLQSCFIHIRFIIALNSHQTNLGQFWLLAGVFLCQVGGFNNSKNEGMKVPG